MIKLLAHSKSLQRLQTETLKNIQISFPYSLTLYLRSNTVIQKMSNPVVIVTPRHLMIQLAIQMPFFYLLQ